MKRIGAVIVGGLIVLVMLGLAYSNFGGTGSALACGGWGSAGSQSCGAWGSPGSSGGGDYVPQRRGLSDSFKNRAPALTQDQAYDVVANQVRKLNPDLKIGRMQDAGSYFEAEVLGTNGDVVQRLGVDKESGRMILIN